MRTLQSHQGRLAYMLSHGRDNTYQLIDVNCSIIIVLYDNRVDPANVGYATTFVIGDVTVVAYDRTLAFVLSMDAHSSEVAHGSSRHEDGVLFAEQLSVLFLHLNHCRIIIVNVVT